MEGLDLSLNEQYTAGGLVTITFDDGYLNQYTNAFPTMNEFGYRGVAFVITGLIGRYFEGRRLMQLWHLKSLKSAGWEIGSHSISHPHLTMLAPEASETELLESKRWGEDNGFSMEALAYPFGNHNDLVEKQAGRIYGHCRTYLAGLNEGSTKNTLLRAVSLWEDLDDCKKWLNQAKAENKWLILVVHGVVESEEQLPPRNEVFGWITKTKFVDFLRYIKVQKMHVTTFEAIRRNCRCED